MNKSKKIKGFKNKKIIELEAKFKQNYVLRCDGVHFKEFRVGKLHNKELNIIHQVFIDLSKVIMKQFSYIKFIYTFDDEINLAFRSNDIGNKKRVQKNLSIMTSFISVQFNKLLRASDYKEKATRLDEYYFDGRFIEIKDKSGVINYFEKEQRKSHTQFYNWVQKMGEKGKKPSVEELLLKYFNKEQNINNYRCLFGCFINRMNNIIRISDSLDEYSKNINNFIQSSI